MKHRFGEIWDVAQKLAGGKGGWREVLDPAAQARSTAQVQPAARLSVRSQTAHVHTHVLTTCEHSQPRGRTRAHRTQTLRAPVGSSCSFSWGVGQRSTSRNLYTSLQEHIDLPPAAGQKLPLPSSCPRVPEPSLGHPWEGPGRDVPSSESLICVHNCFCASVLLCACGVGPLMGTMDQRVVPTARPALATASRAKPDEGFAHFIQGWVLSVPDILGWVLRLSQI